MSEHRAFEGFVRMDGDGGVELVDADGVTMARLRSDRTASRVIVADGDTDCATGHCECGGCGGAVDPWFSFCPYCGVRFEQDGRSDGYSRKVETC